MDLNIVRLADTVQTANTLFQQVRVKRQIEHDQLACELEVTAFGTNLGTQQNLSTGIFFGKPCGCTVTFDDGHTFMEHGGTNAFTLTQNLLKLQCCRRFGTNHQHLLRAVACQVTHQPFNTRVEVPPRAAITFKFLINLLRIEHVACTFFHGFTCGHDAGHFNRGLILQRQWQTNGMQFAFRETFHAITGVTEQHTAGTMAVHQHGDQLLACRSATFTVAVCGLQQRLDILLANQFTQHIELIVGQVIAC